ncbi:MAG: bifunctional pyr operon transcriptional regulator/uracil phosphoribosyltransferase PyrR [Candidatus Neomarinimicrobiota bacterium]|nr:MAG: bifunctional pyr operon transcriptional regulator/uracil phosphoribosyltransferase PyrR [Candidatus Neomarinimicrobiota bacterium]
MTNPLTRVLMKADGLARSITRLAHEILERNEGPDQLILVGILTRGAPLAQRIQKKLQDITGVSPPLGSVDITFHRDDYRERLVVPQVKGTDLPMNLDHATVVLVDDVLYTGRTVRAAIDTIFSYGRPNRIQLAVLVDRGHRELPIKADFVGKNIPTHEGETIHVHLAEVDGRDEVLLLTGRE